METARNAAGEPVTLEQLRRLIVIPDLWCDGELLNGDTCDAKAWAAALDSEKKKAYFAARHRESCEFASVRSEDAPGDSGHSHAQGRVPVNRWRIVLTDALPSTGPDGRMRPDDDVSGTRTRRAFVADELGDSDAVPTRSLSTVLAALVADAVPTGLEIPMGGEWVPAAKVFMHVSTVDAVEQEGMNGIFWGQVQSFVTTHYGSLILRLADATGHLGFLLDGSLLAALDLEDPQRLIGRHVIAYGVHHTPDPGKRPHVRVRAVEHLAFNPRVRRGKRAV